MKIVEDRFDKDSRRDVFVLSMIPVIIYEINWIWFTVENCFKKSGLSTFISALENKTLTILFYTFAMPIIIFFISKLIVYGFLLVIRLIKRTIEK